MEQFRPKSMLENNDWGTDNFMQWITIDNTNESMIENVDGSWPYRHAALHSFQIACYKNETRTLQWSSFYYPLPTPAFIYDYSPLHILGICKNGLPHFYEQCNFRFEQQSLRCHFYLFTSDTSSSTLFVVKTKFTANTVRAQPTYRPTIT